MGKVTPAILDFVERERRREPELSNSDVTSATSASPSTSGGVHSGADKAADQLNIVLPPAWRDSRLLLSPQEEIIPAPPNATHSIGDKTQSAPASISELLASLNTTLEGASQRATGATTDPDPAAAAPEAQMELVLSSGESHPAAPAPIVPVQKGRSKLSNAIASWTLKYMSGSTQNRAGGADWPALKGRLRALWPQLTATAVVTCASLVATLMLLNANDTELAGAGAPNKLLAGIQVNNAKPDHYKNSNVSAALYDGQTPKPVMRSISLQAAVRKPLTTREKQALKRSVPLTNLATAWPRFEMNIPITIGNAKSVPFPVRLERNGSNSNLAIILIQNLPRQASLSKGQQFQTGAWALRPEELEGLRLSLPYNAPDELPLTLKLFDADGNLIASARPRLLLSRDNIAQADAQQSPAQKLTRQQIITKQSIAARLQPKGHSSAQYRQRKKTVIVNGPVVPQAGGVQPQLNAANRIEATNQTEASRKIDYAERRRRLRNSAIGLGAAKELLPSGAKKRTGTGTGTGTGFSFGSIFKSNQQPDWSPFKDN